MPALAQDDAAQNAAIASMFHNAISAVFGPVSNDGSAQWVRADGMMGPATAGQGYYLGADGILYARGPAQSVSQASATATPAGLTISPGLVLLAGIAFLVLKK